MVDLTLSAKDADKVVEWCRETWPRLRGRTWGWGFRDDYQWRQEDAMGTPICHRFWFTNESDLVPFRMVWC